MLSPSSSSFTMFFPPRIWISRLPVMWVQPRSFWAEAMLSTFAPAHSFWHEPSHFLHETLPFHSSSM